MSTWPLSSAAPRPRSRSPSRDRLERRASTTAPAGRPAGRRGGRRPGRWARRVVARASPRRPRQAGRRATPRRSGSRCAVSSSASQLGDRGARPGAWSGSPLTDGMRSHSTSRSSQASPCLAATWVAHRGVGGRRSWRRLYDPRGVAGSVAVMALLRLATFNLLHGMSPADGTADPAGCGRRCTRSTPTCSRCRRSTAASRVARRRPDRAGRRRRSARAGWRSCRPWSAPGGPAGTGADWIAGGDGRRTSGDGRPDVRHRAGLAAAGAALAGHAGSPRPRSGCRCWCPATGPPRLVVVPDEPRVALAAVVEGPRGPFTVVTAHLSFVPGFNVAPAARDRALGGRAAAAAACSSATSTCPARCPARVSGWTGVASARDLPVVGAARAARPRARRRPGRRSGARRPRLDAAGERPLRAGRDVDL